MTIYYFYYVPPNKNNVFRTEKIIDSQVTS